MRGAWKSSGWPLEINPWYALIAHVSPQIASWLPSTWQSPHIVGQNYHSTLSVQIIRPQNYPHLPPKLSLISGSLVNCPSQFCNTSPPPDQYVCVLSKSQKRSKTKHVETEEVPGEGGTPGVATHWHGTMPLIVLTVECACNASFSSQCGHTAPQWPLWWLPLPTVSSKREHANTKSNQHLIWCHLPIATKATDVATHCHLSFQRMATNKQFYRIRSAKIDNFF